MQAQYQKIKSFVVPLNAPKELGDAFQKKRAAITEIYTKIHQNNFQQQIDPEAFKRVVYETANNVKVYESKLRTLLI